MSGIVSCDMKLHSVLFGWKKFLTSPACRRSFSTEDCDCRAVVTQMKTQNDSRDDDLNLPCRKHQVLGVGLYAFMFTPAIGVEIGLGRLLIHVIPRPGLVAILCLAPAIVASFIFGMLIGATIWLLVTKRFIRRDVLASFFVAGPRVAVLSRLCSKVFDWTYAHSRPERKL